MTQKIFMPCVLVQLFEGPELTGKRGWARIRDGL